MADDGFSDWEYHAIDAPGIHLGIGFVLYEKRNKSVQDMLNYGVKLNDKLAGVYNAASYGNFKPSANQYLVYGDLKKQINEQLEIYQDISVTEVKQKRSWMIY